MEVNKDHSVFWVCFKMLGIMKVENTSHKYNITTQFRKKTKNIPVLISVRTMSWLLSNWILVADGQVYCMGFVCALHWSCRWDRAGRCVVKGGEGFYQEQIARISEAQHCPQGLPRIEIKPAIIRRRKAKGLSNSPVCFASHFPAVLRPRWLN